MLKSTFLKFKVAPFLKLKQKKTLMQALMQPVRLPQIAYLKDFRPLCGAVAFEKLSHNGLYSFIFSLWSE